MLSRAVARPEPGADEVAAIPGLRELWQQTTGSPAVCVAVLDGAVDLSHPSLRPAAGRLEVLGPPAPGVASAHGTHVASVIFGQPGGPVQGVAPGCRGLIVPVFPTGPDGALVPCTQRELADAIDRAARAGAHVLNISAGELSVDGAGDTCLVEAVRACERQGRLIVAAAGNDGCAGCLRVPGAIPSPAVLAVGAMDGRGAPLPFSNWGGPYLQQGILAQGADIRGAAPGGGTVRRSGTSFATAVTTGVAALLLSLQTRRGAALSPQAVRRALLASARGCAHQPVPECARLLAGRLNVPGAVELVEATLPPRTGAGRTPTPGAGRGSEPPPPSHTGVTTMSEVLSPRESPQTSAVLPEPAPPAAAPQSPPGGAAVPDRAPAGVAAAGVTAADCGCGGNKGTRQLVYVIGNQLKYDFGTQVRQLSVQGNFWPNGLNPRDTDLTQVPAFLRYLLGYIHYPDPKAPPIPPWQPQGPRYNGNLYDAKAVYWVLYRDNCPLYVLQPQGVFADIVYKQLIWFLIEGNALDLQAAGIPYDCLQGFFECYGGRQLPLRNMPIPTPAGGQPGSQPGHGRHAGHGKGHGESKEPAGGEAGKGGEQQPPPEPPPQPTPEQAAAQQKVIGAFLQDPNQMYYAIAGEVTGRVQLSSGDVVEVINPELRGMSSWDTLNLYQIFIHQVKDPVAATVAFARVVSRLYEVVRNDGKAPEHRALNWAATDLIANLGPYLTDPAQILAGMLGGLDNMAVDTITVYPASCRRTGMEYDVETSFYSFADALRGLILFTETVDVSDIVPVTLGSIRTSTRRR